MLPAHHVQAWYQKVLGETPEAVKPCLEGYMRDVNEKGPCEKVLTRPSLMC